MEAHLLDKVFQKYLSNLTKVYKGLIKGWKIRLEKINKVTNW